MQQTHGNQIRGLRDEVATEHQYREDLQHQLEALKRQRSDMQESLARVETQAQNLQSELDSSLVRHKSELRSHQKEVGVISTLLFVIYLFVFL